MSNASIAQQMYDLFNARDFDGERALLAADAVWVVPGTGERYEGADAVIEVDKAWARAFPDAHLEIERITPAGDQVVVEFRGRGTHTGPLSSPEGEIAPTGKVAEVSFCDVLTLRDGRISEVREYYDSLSMLSQLGLVPATASA